MIKQSKLIAGALGSMFLWLPGHHRTLGEQIPVSMLTGGVSTTSNGTLLNTGQSAIGNGRSETHQMRAGGIYGIVTLSAPPLRSDLDSDGDVDLFDHALFTLCFNPEGNRPGTECHSGTDADFDDDIDVDLTDFAIFLEGWPGQ